MIAPEASPTGAPHGTPTVEGDCRPFAEPWQAPKKEVQGLHRPRHRPGLLLGRDPRPLPGMGLPEEALAHPPAPSVAAVAGNPVPTAEDPEGGRLTGRPGAAGPRPHGAR